MATLQDLIAQVKDSALRERLQEEMDRLLHQKKFGLVFEEHLPEVTPLYDIPLRVGASVARKIGYMKEVYRVLSMDEENVVCVLEDSTDTEEKIFSAGELVTVAKFGEAIYPCLKEMDAVENAPDSDLWHTLIEADNYHALQLLAYLYAGKVDCIYIDPPYNSGAKDWKYNNNYVDANDTYRHSKWLSMMEKRLKLAKKLLNPADSVMIVTIDEKEYLHLGCLLEEIFPDANIQMITSVISGKGVSLVGQFSRVEEYLFIITFGKMMLIQQRYSMLNSSIDNEHMSQDNIEVEFIGLRRRNTTNFRTSRPNQFYPFFVDKNDGHIVKIGDVVTANVDRKTVEVPEGCVAIWPLDPEGRERIWGLIPESARHLLELGCIKIGSWNKSKKTGTIKYWASGNVDKLKKGEIEVKERDKYGTIKKAVYKSADTLTLRPRKVWNMASHNASTYGTLLLGKFLSDKRFAFPKSLYAVLDTLKFFVANKSNALVVDFFAGSGTTLHAVNLLNAEDGGNRRCILVTNNEVSDAEAKALTQQGYKPGDEEWEKLGIARYVTWPRTVCSIEGHDVNGNPLKGDYGVQTERFVKCSDEDMEEDGKARRASLYKKIKEDIYPALAGRKMSDGFRANALYFKLGFLDKTAVSLGTQFKALLSTLWMKAGAIGRCPSLATDVLPDMLLFPENRFAVLLDEMLFPLFTKQMEGVQSIRTIFFVTDSDINFRRMSTEFPRAETYQLYRDYLTNFHINTGRR